MDFINNLEQWRLISEFPNYMVSSCGRVMNIRTFRVLKPLNNRVLKPLNNRGEYLYVYLCSNVKTSHKYIHRLLAEAFILNLTDLPCVDHIDRNKLNNHISNLRWCTREENQHNRSKNKNGTSMYKGVSFHKASNKWQAKIRHNGLQIHLGLFTDEVEAAQEYDRKASELFGVFAVLNF